MLRSSAAQVSEPHHGVSSADARAAHEHSAARRQQERRRSAGSGWRRVAAAHSSSCHAWCSRTWAGRIGRRCTQSGCPSQGGEGGESERSEAAYIRRNSGKAGAAAACWLLFVWSARRLHHGSMPSRQARPVAPQGPHGGERGGRTRRGNEFNSKPPALGPARRAGATAGAARAVHVQAMAPNRGQTIPINSGRKPRFRHGFTNCYYII